MALKLVTNAFFAGGRLPARFTCDDVDASPPLMWSGAPKGTRSFALVCSDSDAPSGTFYHWGIYDIPASLDRLPERYPHEHRGVVHQATNDFRRRGYNGPCPPPRHGTHHYHFRLYALPVEHLALAPAVHASEVERAAGAQAIAQAEIVATYSR